MSDERNNRITIRITDKEMNILKEAAEKDDRNVSSFVRMYALKYAKEHFGEMQDIIEEERLIAKREEILDRKMKISRAEFEYETAPDYVHFK